MENVNYINKYFDRVYVITCKNFTERHNYIKNHFLSNNINFEFFNSIDKNLLIHNKLTTSELSLLLSHLNCVLNAKLNSYKKILICEDDINFNVNLENEFINFVEKLPLKWDFLQLGNQFWAEKWLKRKYISENLYKFEWGTGSHCIAINSSVYDSVIEKLSLMNAPVDFLYYYLFESHICYCPENFLADALSKSIHLKNFDKKYIFDSTITHNKN